MFIAGRAVVGFGLTISTVASALLISELCYHKQRAPVTAVFNSTWDMGSMLAAWITFGTFSMPSTWSWRLPALFQVAPSLLQVCLIWLLPESPRWLLSKDRTEDAQRILAKYHANGDENDPYIHSEMAEIRKALELEQEQRSVSWRSFLFDGE